jgi:hypothetical protein
LNAGEKSEKHTPEKKTMLSPMKVLDPKTCAKKIGQADQSGA